MNDELRFILGFAGRGEDENGLHKAGDWWVWSPNEPSNQTTPPRQTAMTTVKTTNLIIYQDLGNKCSIYS